MTDQLHLPQRYRRILEGLLREHVPEAEVWAYGSRITGESHDGSDLDLVIRGPELKPLDDGFFELLEAIEQSNIPILVQAHDWARLPESFHAEIERDYVVVQEGEEEKTPTGEWRELPFSEAVTINPTIQLDRGTVYPYVEMAVVNSDSRIANSLEKREFKGSGSKFQNGDTLMARITPCLENGKIARYQSKDDSESAHGSTEFIVIRGRPGVTDNDFAYYLTRSDEVRNYAIGQMTGTSGRQRVPVDSLDHLVISIPPLPDQRDIAHILGTLDDKIELNRRMNETLEEMARALFKSWFIDFDPVRAKAALASPPSENSNWTVDRAQAYLDSMDKDIVDLLPDKLVDSELGEIPEGWEVKAVGELIDLAYGKALKANDRKPGAIPVYGSNGQVGWHNRGIVAGPGIVVGRKGNPGVVTWVHSDFFPIDTTFYVVPKVLGQKLTFLFFALSHQDLPSVSADSAVPGLNRNLAYMNRQLVPDIAIVREFDKYVGTIFSRRHDLDEESRALSSKRDSLLPRLVSGQMIVV